MTQNINHRFTFLLPGKRTCGFTLLEILVSMTVLTLLIVLIAQLTSGAASVTTGGHKRMDDESQARLVLDRLAVDFSRMLKRDDVDYGFVKKTGNDAFSFYCESSGYQPTPVPTGIPRTLAVIGYSVNPAGINGYMLARGARSLGWGEMIFSATQSLQPTNTLPAVDPSYYEVLGDQVCRLEVCYLKRGDPATGTLPVLTTVAPSKIADVAAVVVAVAVLDGKSRAVVNDTQLGKLVDALPDAQNDKDIASLWSPIVSQTSSLAASTTMPASAAAAVRIYQRYYYIRSGL